MVYLNYKIGKDGDDEKGGDEYDDARYGDGGGISQFKDSVGRDDDDEDDDARYGEGGGGCHTCN